MSSRRRRSISGIRIPSKRPLRDERVYARGIADDKGQLYMQLKAAEELKARDALPVNLRFCCDGEEETGGQSIVDFLAADERGADACVIFDAGMLKRDVPLFNVATRGLIYLHIRGPDGSPRPPLGSLRRRGAERAARPRAGRLDVVVPRTGACRSQLRAGIAPPTEAELAAWAELTLDPKSSPPKARARWTPGREDEFYLRTFAEPSLDVNGIEGGSPHLQKTVLPAEAHANVSIRLAPGQDPDQIAAEAERLLREAAPEGAELEITRLVVVPIRAHRSGFAGRAARLGRVRARGRPPAAPRPQRRDAADRARTRRQGDSDDRDRLRAAGLEHPLSEREPARRLPAR